MYVKWSKEKYTVLGAAVLALFALGLLDFTYQNDLSHSGEEVRIGRVIDGDTIEIVDGRRVRYIGIDAPEVDDCYGIEALERNVELVMNKEVVLVSDGEDTDDYGRLLRKVYVEGEDVSALLVKGGYAWVDTWFASGSYETQLLRFEGEAKEGDRGVWRFCRRQT